MKTNILMLAALAFSVNAISQSSCALEHTQQTPSYSADKMAAINQQKMGNFTVSVIDPSWITFSKTTPHYSAATAMVVEDGYKMVGNAMVVLKNGTQTDMLNYTTVKNGNLVLINGVVITKTGTMLFLKNGDSINMKGLVTRSVELDKTVASR